MADALKARIITERMAVLLQASLLLQHANPATAGAFIETRLKPETLAYGGLRDVRAIDELLEVITF